MKDFLHALVQSKPLLEKDANESSLTLEVWDNKVDSKDEEEMLANAGNKSALKDSKQCDSKHDFLFTIDKHPNIKNDLDIPKYGQVTSSFLYTSISWLIFLLSLCIYLQSLICLTSIEEYRNILWYTLL